MHEVSRNSYFHPCHYICLVQWGLMHNISKSLTHFVPALHRRCLWVQAGSQPGRLAGLDFTMQKSITNDKCDSFETHNRARLTDLRAYVTDTPTTPLMDAVCQSAQEHLFKTLEKQ